MYELFIYLLSFLSIISLMILFFRQKSVLVFMPIVLIFLYYFPVFFDVLNGSSLYPTSTINSANIFALYLNFNIFFISFLIYYLYNFKSDKFDLVVEKGALKIYSKIFIFSFFVLLFAVFLSTKGNILSYSWASRHAEDGDNLLFLLATYIFVATSGVLFLSWYNKQKLTFFVLVVFSLLFILLIRSRGYIIPVFLTFAIYFLIWKKKYIVSLLISLIFLSLFFLLQQFRFLGSLEGSSEINLSSMVDNISEQIKYGDSDLSLRNSFFYFIQNFEYLSNYYNFGDFYTFRRLIFFWDVFDLGLKPKDFTNIMYLSYYGDNKYISHPTLHPTLYGIVYANGGYVSSLLFSIIVGLIVFLEKKIKSYNFFVYWLTVPIFLYAVVFISRGSVYNAIMFLSLNVFLVFIIYIFLIRFNFRFK